MDIRAFCSLVLAASVSGLPIARADADRSTLQEVVVTATRVAANPFDVAAAISTVSGGQLRDDALGLNLADDIGSVPGLLARNRNNYAQDQQISIRGIGANSTFGIRGVRVYQDGIPASGPDGQGQVSQFNLDSAERVEILRGPFSALYGNSAGGVIQIFTADGEGPLKLRTSLAYGSFETLRADANASGSSGGLSYNLDISHFSIEGFRLHSSAKNDSFNTKLRYTLNDASRLTLIGNVLARPDSLDPLGLTQSEFAANPNQTDPAAAKFDTRKSLQQQMAGLIYDLDVSDAQSVRVMGYYGHRIVQQFLAIPVSVEAPATSSGAVVDLNREFGGADARWTWKGELAGRPMSWVAGVSYDRQNELRRGYNNFVGSILGIQGKLRRDENDIARNLDEYAQGTWDFAPRWSLMAGVRRSDVHFDSADHFITPTNGNDSGGVSYGATSPVAGVVFKARNWLHLYGSYGQGFQTPLGSELAYRADGSPGLNFALQPARSDNSEAGAKLQLGADFNAEAAVFQTLTHDEIVVDTNLGGRSTYQNASRTRRQGVEASFDYRLAPRWRLQFAYTYISAVYSDGYLTCVAAPCALPRVRVAAGSRLPGVPKDDAYLAVRWGEDLGWHASATAQYVTDVAVNDVNSVFAPSYAVFGADAGYGIDLGSMQLNAFLRVNNLLNRVYVGSVIVDDGNGRYFETAPGFSVLGGVRLTFK
ncbi:MAG TPA: TonB-dependent receptor [Steroidobacteraceae bacterium]